MDEEELVFNKDDSNYLYVVLDSGASIHQTNDKKLLEKFKTIKEFSITGASGQVMRVTGRGIMKLYSSVTGRILKLKYIMHQHQQKQFFL